MIVDNKRTVHLLIQHCDIILPYEVVEQLLHTSKKCDKRYLLHLYLHALFEIDIHAGKDFHDMQVSFLPSIVMSISPIIFYIYFVFWQ